MKRVTFNESVTVYIFDENTIEITNKNINENKDPKPTIYGKMLKFFSMFNYNGRKK